MLRATPTDTRLGCRQRRDSVTGGPDEPATTVSGPLTAFSTARPNAGEKDYCRLIQETWTARVCEETNAIAEMCDDGSLGLHEAMW